MAGILVSANMETGYIEIYSKYTNKILFNLDSLPSGTDIIETHKQLEKAIRIAETEAFNAAGSLARSAITKAQL